MDGNREKDVRECEYPKCTCPRYGRCMIAETGPEAGADALLALAADCEKYAKIIEGIYVVAAGWKPGDPERREPRETLLKAAAVLRARPTADMTAPVAWCGWHPNKGYNFGTIADTPAGAASRLMQTGIAGDHKWSVEPLYASPLSSSPSPAGQRTILEEFIAAADLLRQDLDARIDAAPNTAKPVFIGLASLIAVSNKGRAALTAIRSGKKSPRSEGSE